MSQPGESGYINSVVRMFPCAFGTAQYTGGGIAGWLGGSPIEFACRMRTFDDQIQRAQLSDGPMNDAFMGECTLVFEGEGYFKGAIYPPRINRFGFVRIQVNVIFTIDAVFLVEAFRPVGVIEEGVKYFFRGRSVGLYSITDSLI